MGKTRNKVPRFALFGVAAACVVATQALLFAPVSPTKRMTTRPGTTTPGTTQNANRRLSTVGPLRMSPDTPLDMDSPEVTAAFKKVEKLDIDVVIGELEKIGIPHDESMDDMSLRLMLMECRVRMDRANKPKEPGPNANAYQRLVYEKPFIRKYEDELWEMGDVNSVNVFREYIVEPEVARERYGDVELYRNVFRQADIFIKMPKFSSKQIKFAGFPSAIGEEAVKQSLEDFGQLKSFEVTKNDDTEIAGIAVFKTQEGADKAVLKWDGADMGMGTTLTLEYMPK